MVQQSDQSHTLQAPDFQRREGPSLLCAPRVQVDALEASSVSKPAWCTVLQIDIFLTHLYIFMWIYDMNTFMCII
jgi:hypothetical protein